LDSFNEYLFEYIPTSKCVGDDKEEPTMYDKILEGVKKDRVMTPDFLKLIHGFVLDNIKHMDPYKMYDLTFSNVGNFLLYCKNMY
jgi:hypothetical protein